MTERIRRNQQNSDEAKLSKPASKRGQFQRHCLQLLREHQAEGTIPTNGRFIFYEGEQRGFWPKHYTGSTAEHPRQPSFDVSDALTWLREKDIIPWDWITDETREIADWNSGSSIADYLLDAVEYARLNPWGDKRPPLIICESRATKGVLEHICRDYLTPIASTNGQCGGFLHTDVVPYLQNDDCEYNGREVGYIGDHEVGGPGDQIEANTQRVLQQCLTHYHPLRWKRIALTQTQVDRRPHLAELVITKTDGRCKPPRVYQAVECEAVGQRELERLLRSFLNRRLPEPLDQVREREQRQREDMRRRLQELLNNDQTDS
jgi:hypothetical protein